MRDYWICELVDASSRTPRLIVYDKETNKQLRGVDLQVALHNKVVEERDYLRSVVMKLAEGKVIEHTPREDGRTEALPEKRNQTDKTESARPKICETLV